MKRFHLSVSLFSVSIGLLLIQIIILQALIKKEGKHESIDPVWKTLAEVTSIAYRQGIPLFLSDPRILRHIQNGSFSGHVCRILCLGQKITHLSTIGPLSSQGQKNTFIEELKSLGFHVLVFTGPDPVLLHHDLNVPVPLHFIISQESHVIHIMIIYERPGKFWWIGALKTNDRLLRDMAQIGISEKDFFVTHSAAALDKVEIQPAAVDNIKIFLPIKPQPFLDYNDKGQFIECDYARAKKFHERYGRDESDEAELFRTKAWKLLSKAKTLLDQLNVPFWLSSGTCLGFYRQCDFISYSKDLDLGIWITDYRPEIISAFSTHDLPLTHSFGKVDDSFELSFRDGDLKLDIFFFYEEHDHVWNGGTQARTGMKFKYIFPKFKLCWTEFLELRVRVPCQTEDYIKANYGQNWFEPVKIWDWKSSPPNVLENGQWPIEEWPEVIQLYPLPEQT